MKTSVKVVFTVLFIVLLAVSCGSPQLTEDERSLVNNELVGIWNITDVMFADPAVQTVIDSQPVYSIVT